MSDWDAERYHRLSDPQQSWGLTVLDRLAPVSGERILDIGCGTARLTSGLIARVPSVKAAGLDRSWTMLKEARRRGLPAIGVVQAEALRLPFAPVFDAVFSTATFHWVHDHRLLFAEIHRVLRPGGRLVSQAGGGPNLARLYERSAILARQPEFAPYFEGWVDPWTFAGVDETRMRLKDTGFTDIEVWLESTPTTFPDGKAFGEFVSTVCLRHHLARLPSGVRPEYLARVIDLAKVDDPALTLDYWRLNIDARK